MGKQNLLNAPLKANSTSVGPIEPVDIQGLLNAPLKAKSGFQPVSGPSNGSFAYGVDVNKFDYDGGLAKLPSEGGIAAMESQRADRQRWYQYLGKGVTTMGTRFLGEVFKMPGAVGSLVGESMDKVFGSNITEGDTYAETFENNAWLNYVDDLTKTIQDAVPLYARDRNQYGGFVRTTLLNPHFYATQGADAIGFAASFLTPGLAIKALKVGTTGTKLLSKGMSLVDKNNKLGLFKTAASIGATGSNIEVATATAMSTFLEASSESRETMKHLRAELEAKGELNQQEIDEKVAEVGRNIFTSNALILAGPNLLTNKILLGAFKGAGRTTGMTVTGSGINTQVAYKGLTGAQKYGKIAKDMGLGIFSESMEELSQTTADSFFSEKALKGEEAGVKDLAANLIDEYTKALGTTEGQQAMYLGALMGGIMGGGAAYRGQQQVNKRNEALVANMNSNMSGFARDIAAPYVKDGKGNIQYDIAGNPVLDKDKVMANLIAKVDMKAVGDVLAYAIESNDKVLYNEVFNKAFTGMVTPYTMVDGGMEILQSQLEGLYSIQEASQKQLVSSSNPVTVNKEKVIADLMQTAKEIKDYSQVYHEYISHNLDGLKQGELSQERFDQFKSASAVSFIEAMSAIKQAKKDLAEIESDTQRYNDFEDLFSDNANATAKIAWLNNTIKSHEAQVDAIKSKKAVEKAFKTFKGKAIDFEVEKVKYEEQAKKDKVIAEKKAKVAEKVERNAKEREAEKVVKEKKVTDQKKVNEAREAAEEAKRRAGEDVPMPEDFVAEEDERLDPEDVGDLLLIDTEAGPGFEDTSDIVDAEDFGDIDNIPYVSDHVEGEIDITNEEPITPTETTTKDNKDIGKETYPKKETVSQVIGVNNKIQKEFHNIPDEFVAYLTSFSGKAGQVVSFILDTNRPYWDKNEAKVMPILAKIRAEGKASLQDRKILYAYLPINVTIGNVASPASKGGTNKDQILLDKLIDGYAQGFEFEEMFSVIVHQNNGTLATTIGNKNNILDLEYINGDIKKVKLFRVNNKGVLLDSAGKPVPVPPVGKNKSGSVYLRVKLYNGQEEYLSLDTAKVNPNQADSIIDLLLSQIEASPTEFISELPSDTRAKIEEVFAEDIAYLDNSKLRTRDLLDFLLHTGPSIHAENRLHLDGNTLTVGNHTLSGEVSLADMKEIFDMLTQHKYRKVSFKGKNSIKNNKYLSHVVTTGLVTTNANTKDSNGEQMRMYEGNVNIAIDNTNIIAGSGPLKTTGAKENIEKKLTPEQIAELRRKHEQAETDKVAGETMTYDQKISAVIPKLNKESILELVGKDKRINNKGDVKPTWVAAKGGATVDEAVMKIVEKYPEISEAEAREAIAEVVQLTKEEIGKPKTKVTKVKDVKITPTKKKRVVGRKSTKESLDLIRKNKETPKKDIDKKCP